MNSKALKPHQKNDATLVLGLWMASLPYARESFFPWQMGAEDPLTATLLSWLMLMLGLPQLAEAMALRAVVGATWAVPKEMASPPPPPKRGRDLLLPPLQWEAFLTQLLG